MSLLEKCILPLLCLSVIFSGCKTTSPKVEDAVLDKAKVVTRIEKDGSQTKIYNHFMADLNPIIFNPSQHSWSDINRYYKEAIPKQKNSPHYRELKYVSIWHLFMQFDLSKEGSQRDIEFYYNEISAFDWYGDVRVTAQCLEGLKPYWTQEKIREAAKHQHDKYMQYNKENFSAYDTLLDTQIEGLNYLLRLAGST